MAGLYASHGARIAPQSALTSRILYILTALPLCLAAFAFALQWRGFVHDQANLTNLGGDRSKFPGMGLSGVHTGTRADCMDHLHRSETPSFPHHPGWQYALVDDANPKICVTTSTSGGLDQILPWLYYHRVIGVSHFLLFVEGKASSANVTAVLESIPGVRVVPRTKELEEKQAKSRIWNESWLSSFFFRPCNYELFVKQSLNMEMAIVMAREVGADWIIHLDTDELLHPAGAPEYSLRRLLKDVSNDIDMVVFPNYESAVEQDSVQDPFTEVTMFKKNYDHVTKETYFGLYREATRSNPNYFLTYGNGKAAARIQDHLRPNGAHRWHNYMKTPKEIKLDEAAVLHYTYSKFSDLTSRRDRCGCKPTKEDVKRCFMLEFDREAFIIASTASEEEMWRWYRERVVWTDKQLNLKLLRKGLLTRIYAPQVIMQGLRQSGTFSDALAAGQDILQKTHVKEAFLSSLIASPEDRRSPLPAENSTVIMDKKQTQQKWQDIGNSGSSRKLLTVFSVPKAAIPPIASPIRTSPLDSWLGDFFS
ncbi:hypothetical protein O6H91_05G096500 [Diphasiastrum complanatum]|uniref:Uncharacterized protein n=1 Tax=Diphasiastrum complanatum TaxID=34168 RepID=A0ACC2DRH3_DIPCM|nr:hypothetical protein O6H91_05G096500 [Diphasiastrum complanatum]